jgi:hypothetical protein
MELQQLLHYQIIPKIQLFLLNFIIDATSLIHQMHRYHQLNVSLHFTYFTLKPIILIQMNTQAPKPNINAEPAIGIWSLIWS